MWIHLCQQPANHVSLCDFVLKLKKAVVTHCGLTLCQGFIFPKADPPVNSGTLFLIQEEEGFLRRKVFELYLCF